MARRLDFYAWYPADYRADTVFLTREEDFAYRAILDEIFLSNQDACRVEDDDMHLARIAKATAEEWRSIRAVIIDGPRAMLQKRGKWISSTRLTEEIEKAHAKSRKNSKIAKDRWDREKECERTANASDSHYDTDAIRREEKRREEKKTPSESLRRPAGEQIEGFVLTEEIRAYAAVHGQDAGELLPAFQDHFRANGYRTRTGPVKDATAAFRTWIRNAERFSKPGERGVLMAGGVKIPIKGPDNLPIDPVGAKADQIREELRNTEADLLVPFAWAHPFTREDAQAWCDLVRGEYADRLSDAPTLNEFLSRKGAVA